jgi:hypothetical protein
MDSVLRTTAFSRLSTTLLLSHSGLMIFEGAFAALICLYGEYLTFVDRFTAIGAPPVARRIRSLPMAHSLVQTVQRRIFG